jgi:tetratricopeptide (TPR) repeat protein
MVLDWKGEVIDWKRGYRPPSVNVRKWLEKVLSGTGTYAGLMDRFEKNPNDLEAATELGQKYEEILQQDRALEFYRKALKAHASGAEGSISYGLVKIPCAEFAEYSIASLAMLIQDRESPSEMKAFVEKYPKSPLLQQAYRGLSDYYSWYGRRKEAEKFFEEYLTRFPDEPGAYFSYAERILRDEGDAEKGTLLMEKAVELNRLQVESASRQIGSMIPDLAKLRAIKGDDARSTAEVFDEEFLQDLGGVFTQELAYFANFWLGQNILRDEVEKYAGLSFLVAPERLSNLISVARIYLRLNRADRALTIFGPDYAKKNWDRAPDLSIYADFWARKGLNLGNALDAARRSVELEPDGYYCWHGLSMVLLKLKNYEAALQAAEKTVELTPSLAHIYKSDVEQIKKLMKKK